MKFKIVMLIILIIPFIAFAQGAPKKSAYLFYLETCPHCHNVDKYFAENGLYNKYDIKKLDAAVPSNGKFLEELYAANNFPEEQRGGVPVAAFGDKFFVGDKPIIDNFVKEIDASESAFQLPDPEGGVSASDLTVHEGSISPESSVSEPPSAENPDSGNKRNYFPVVIAAIIVVGAGALIVSNRES